MSRRSIHFGLLMTILSLCHPERVAAQDITTFTQFYFNPSLLNSSLTGMDGRPVLHLAYRQQWAGLSGGPTIANLNLQTSFASGLNLGVNLNNYTTGQLSTSALQVTGAYSLPLSDTQVLRFGLSMGFASSRVDVNALSFAAPNDPVLADLAKTTFQLTGNAGLSYHNRDFHAGVSLPNIFEPSYVNTDAFTIAKVSPFESVILHASNRFYLAKGKNVFEPYLVYRLNSTLPSQIEAAAVFHIQHVAYVGGSYKQNFGISALMGFKPTKQLAIGYSYSIQNTGTNQINRPTHEIHIGLLFGERRENVIVYSFVDTEKEKVKKKTNQELAAEKKKRDAEAAKKKQEEVAKAKLADEEKKKAELAAAAALKVEGDRKAAEEKIAMEEQLRLEEEHMKRTEIHADNPTELHNEEGHPNAERHEFVKRGTHHAELDLGDYVIAGVFTVEANAKRFSDDLVKLGFKDTDYGYLTANKRWYVHIAEGNDIPAMRALRDQFRKMKIFRDAWLLTVQN